MLIAATWESISSAAAIEESRGAKVVQGAVLVLLRTNPSAAPWFDRHGKTSPLLPDALPLEAWSSPVRSNTRRVPFQRSTNALPFSLPFAGWALERAEMVVPTSGREETRLGLGPAPS